MKKIILFALLTISLNLSAQEKITEGIVLQKQTFSSSNEQMNEQLAMMGDMQSTTYFKANKSRNEMSSAMTGETSIIMDNDKKDMLILMNNAQLGKKYVAKSFTPTEEELKKIVVIPSDETKTILGYKCKRYDATFKNDDGAETKMILYTSEDITAMSEQMMSLSTKVSGFPMYMEINAIQNGMDMTIKTEVTEVKNEKVSDEKFSLEIPEGYEDGSSLLGN
jgi:hypothetical protein